MGEIHELTIFNIASTKWGLCEYMECEEVGEDDFLVYLCEKNHKDCPIECLECKDFKGHKDNTVIYSDLFYEELGEVKEVYNLGSFYKLVTRKI